MTAKKIALFIDADNISAKFGKQIMETLESRGEIFIRRIYGNWEKFSLHGWNECILNFSFRAVQQPDYAAGKNATDMSLTIDAMDVLYGGKAEIFALVSNDSDFTPLAIRLREGGMKILGMGNAQASSSFRFACDEFIDLDVPAEIEIPVAPKKKISPPEKISPVQLNLFSEEKAPAPPQVVTSSKVVSINDGNNERDKKIQQIHDVLCAAAKIHGDADGFCSLNDARTDLMNKNFGFTVRDFGFNQLRDFINAFPKLYEVRQDDSGKNFCYRCLPIEQKISDAKLRQIHEVLRETAKTHDDGTGFVNLGNAGSALAQKNLSIKGSGHKTLSKFISAFPNLYELKQNSYRCK